ncbi:DUF4040 domain-containing protein [Halorubrum vacuolatum]|uniref:Multisubunit sodium/proton antiporter, MrpB subunit n=1 Tax=Halorubrum vacuolatum TaxID=63740 RepID=A0A238XYX8_HALVU|nr:DUF4040 domain-containing protein [Halorubrum vacuolatum]SNR63564.1 multisubunit sodium/proton antiporter, MrpB subunit [Halorubrum vacuolatum]
MTPLEIALVAFVVIGALVLPITRDLVGAIVTFAVLTLGTAVIWVLLAAPDVALIEAAVGAGVISVLFVLTVVKTTGFGETDDEIDSDRRFRPISLPTLALVGALAVPLGYAFLALDPVGAADAPAVSGTFPTGEQTPYDFYVQESLEQTGFPNAVVAVLVVYRGLDTLGELIVAFAAAVSILIVLGREDLL